MTATHRRETDFEQYFWNEHLTSPFVEAGFTEYITPIMQGFVGQREFVIKGETSQAAGQDESGPSTSTSSTDDLSSISTTPETPAEDKTLLITLISRRSVKRNGLRYLRRGIDEEGYVANAVETEQILSTSDWDNDSGIHSFVQCRGSIPLFFSQIPYSFKPVPTLHGSPEANQKAMHKHYQVLEAKYGSVHCVSLVDRHGTEPKIGQAYEDNINTLNKSGGVNNHSIGFNWWEFHHICRGMKFENVSQLVAETADFLTSSSWSSTTNDNMTSTNPKTQSGIIRTNCMDCLDRTNVVQSAFGQHILEAQLASLPQPLTLSGSPAEHTWFNTLWADNGDAISRAYTGTSALKGDYTRTRRRNVLGALNDFSLTLSRYYQNLFEDFFAQAAIDYLLGTVGEEVFVEFEATMTTADPAVDLRKARQSAIAMAANVVVERDEDMISGWALASPHMPNTLRTYPFEETLLLLTDKAAYVVRFDWATEKVKSFERVALERLVGVQWGAYITEANTKGQLDQKRNVGLVMQYKFSEEDEGVKVFTRSLETAGEAPAAEAVESSQVERNSQAGKQEEEKKESDTSVAEDVKNADTTDKAATTKKAEQKKDIASKKASAFKSSTADSEVRFYAFKALPSRVSAVKLKEGESLPPSERELVKQIATDIERARAKIVKPADDSQAGGVDEEKKQFKVVEGDIISADEARKSTGYLESIGYKLKAFVWG